MWLPIIVVALPQAIWPYMADTECLRISPFSTRMSTKWRVWGSQRILSASVGRKTMLGILLNLGESAECSPLKKFKGGFDMDSRGVFRMPVPQWDDRRKGWSSCEILLFSFEAWQLPLLNMGFVQNTWSWRGEVWLNIGYCTRGFHRLGMFMFCNSKWNWKKGAWQNIPLYH